MLLSRAASPCAPTVPCAKNINRYPWAQGLRARKSLLSLLPEQGQELVPKSLGTGDRGGDSLQTPLLGT